MRFGHGEQFLELREIALHRVDAFDDDERPLPFPPLQRRLERVRIVVLESIEAGTRQHRAVAQAQVRTIVHDRDIRFAQQTGDHSERAAEAAVEQHRVVAPEKIGQRALQLPVQIGHAGKSRRATGAEAVFRERLGSRPRSLRGDWRDRDNCTS